jgi:hypothetical protein
MSYKTDRLVALFPRAYAALDAESLIYKVLDVFGAELTTADGKVKDLLKSHWVRYASGAALDGLGAIYGVERRSLRGGQPEPDDAFRARLEAVVPLFTGGGTRRAVLGAVRSALGLPFDLDQLRIPASYAALRSDIESLVAIVEFSPLAQRVVADAIAEVAGASELTLVVDLPTVGESRPRIDWKFDRGDGRSLTMERVDAASGVRSLDGFTVPAGKTLTLTADADGRLSAAVDRTDVSTSFVNLNGSSPAVLPAVPVTRSEWKFRARSGFFGSAVFDGSGSFDLPGFSVQLSLVRFQPLTFDVYVPYFLQKAVADLKARYNYPGDLLVFEGLPPERIQDVIDQTRTAGVQGNIHFTLNFFETHDPRETFAMVGAHQVVEDANAADALVVSDISSEVEVHQIGEHFAIGATFDISKFDGAFGLV